MIHPLLPIGVQIISVDKLHTPSYIIEALRKCPNDVLVWDNRFYIKDSVIGQAVLKYPETKPCSSLLARLIT